ncbi:Protein kinase domain-containing protein [Mycena kentingensis (nom. inval.)]|nr:Protein kinase domain-containing protein [Mycena kentingensis (nom. inval.)]
MPISGANNHSSRPTTLPPNDIPNISSLAVNKIPGQNNPSSGLVTNPGVLVGDYASAAFMGYLFGGNHDPTPGQIVSTCKSNRKAAQEILSQLHCFNEMFPNGGKAEPTVVNQSLKDFTANGTEPFMAIELLKYGDVAHCPHHDFESLCWLLLWMVIRNTKHIHPYKADACSVVFGDVASKSGSLMHKAPLRSDTPLYSVLEAFRKLVLDQNPGKPIELVITFRDEEFEDDEADNGGVTGANPPRYIRFKDLRRILRGAVAHELSPAVPVRWPQPDDPALHLVPRP